jgi:hypothetical protein
MASEVASPLMRPTVRGNQPKRLVFESSKESSPIWKSQLFLSGSGICHSKIHRFIGFVGCPPQKDFSDKLSVV